MCECEICKYGRLVEQNLAGLPEPQKTFFEDMYERLCYAEDDVAWYKAILDGTWPNARNILTGALYRCKDTDDDT